MGREHGDRRAGRRRPRILWQADGFLLGGRRRLDGHPLGALRAADLTRLGRLRALLARLPGPLAGRQIPGPRLAPLHGPHGHGALDAGRGDLRRRLHVPLLLGADDHRLVPADPLRRRAARDRAGRPGLPHHDAHRLRAARGGLRHARPRVRLGRLRSARRLLRRPQPPLCSSSSCSASA